MSTQINSESSTLLTSSSTSTPTVLLALVELSLSVTVYPVCTSSEVQIYIRLRWMIVNPGNVMPWKWERVFFFSGDEPYNDSNNDDVPPCASHCVHFNGAKLSFHKWEGCERKQTFLEFFLQFSLIETVFQVQTMILAVSGSTANTADPLDGNGVTPVYAGPWIHQKKNTNTADL